MSYLRLEFLRKLKDQPTFRGEARFRNSDNDYYDEISSVWRTIWSHKCGLPKGKSFRFTKVKPSSDPDIDVATVLMYLPKLEDVEAMAKDGCVLQLSEVESDAAKSGGYVLRT